MNTTEQYHKNKDIPQSFETDFSYKVHLLKRIMCLSVIFSLLFSLMASLNVIQIGKIHTCVNYLYTLIILCLLLAIKRNNNRFNPILLCYLFFSFLLCLSALYLVTLDGFRAIWFYLLILVAFMLGGQKSGFLFTLLSLLAITSTNWLIVPFSTPTFLTIAIGLVVMSLVLSTFTAQVNLYRQHIEKQNNELNYLANKDPLIEVLHAKNYCQLSKKYIIEAQQQNENLSIIYAGIDNLKRIKDKYGNHIGDIALKHVIALIKTQLQQKDLLDRVGEEKFCIILPEKDAIAARSLAISIQNTVRNRLLNFANDKIPLTLSIGVASLNDSDEEIRSIQVRADKGLTKAKDCGGDDIKICTCFDELSEEF